jgi:DEAD/DEAH box helicase domain-containing protein
VKGLRRNEVAAGLLGIAHLARNLAPIYCLADARDIGAEAQVRAPFTHEPTVFLYDTIPGGVGLAQRLFEVREQLLRACRDAVAACACDNGCPSCVGPQVEPESPAKRSAQVLLERYLG